MAIFGNGSEPPASRPPGLQTPAQVNMIGEGTVIEGTVRATSDVRVSGRIIGKLEVEGKAIVATEGVIDGELSATNADIAGLVEGEVLIADRTVLKSTARVEGTLRTARLVVEEGALLNGNCEMGQLNAARAESLRKPIPHPLTAESFS